MYATKYPEHFKSWALPSAPNGKGKQQVCFTFLCPWKEIQTYQKTGSRSAHCTSVNDVFIAQVHIAWILPHLLLKHVT